MQQGEKKRTVKTFIDFKNIEKRKCGNVVMAINIEKKMLRSISFIDRREI